MLAENEQSCDAQAISLTVIRKTSDQLDASVKLVRAIEDPHELVGTVRSLTIKGTLLKNAIPNMVPLPPMDCTRNYEQSVFKEMAGRDIAMPSASGFVPVEASTSSALSVSEMQEIETPISEQRFILKQDYPIDDSDEGEFPALTELVAPKKEKIELTANEKPKRTPKQACKSSARKRAGSPIASTSKWRPSTNRFILPNPNRSPNAHWHERALLPCHHHHYVPPQPALSLPSLGPAPDLNSYGWQDDEQLQKPYEFSSYMVLEPGIGPYTYGMNYFDMPYAHSMPAIYRPEFVMRFPVMPCMHPSAMSSQPQPQPPPPPPPLVAAQRFPSSDSYYYRPIGAPPPYVGNSTQPPTTISRFAPSMDRRDGPDAVGNLDTNASLIARTNVAQTHSTSTHHNHK